MRSLIKKESANNRQGEGAPKVIIQTVPCTADEMSKIQKRYSRLARETECVWREALTSRDCVLLSEDEE